MLKAKEVKQMSDMVADRIKKEKEDSFLKDLDKIKENIFSRIQKAANTEDKPIYSIYLSSEELYIIENTKLFQSLGYRIIPEDKYPWGGDLSWQLPNLTYTQST